MTNEWWPIIMSAVGLAMVRVIQYLRESEETETKVESVAIDNAKAAMVAAKAAMVEHLSPVTRGPCRCKVAAHRGRFCGWCGGKVNDLPAVRASLAGGTEG